VLATLGAWLVLSVIQQFSPPWFARVQGIDIFGLIPLWTFFAPNPGHSDYHLVYRDELHDGTITPWREVPMCELRGPRSFIWNPEKRSKKVLADVAAALVQHADATSELETLVSLPYLILLNVIAAEEPVRAAARQFVLVETFGFLRRGPTRALLVSRFHPLETRLEAL